MRTADATVRIEFDVLDREGCGVHPEFVEVAVVLDWNAVGGHGGLTGNFHGLENQHLDTMKWHND